ncbi:FecR domain-containing protein [Paenibacillus sp. HN-1]|uniref:FecR domain-containing protein n=1 Tax=Paenibacillus TaxID=44249 RepID=UPI001CA88AA2|nr:MULTISPECIES: FecR domain-containing protein [Paenibacillus]MBY9079092.1 FecR domain-containing protein [Paenibacillus sp. CGMCC 1.18879]MBY9086870.1 FecR domain-containing protein [Paenibacillus sinensis]
MHTRFIHSINILLLFTLLTGLLGGCSSSATADPLSVRVEAIEGSVSVLTASGEQRELTHPDTLQTGDTVRTGDYASCSIIYEDGTATTLGGGTSLTIGQADSSGVRLRVSAGRIWIKVKHLIVGEESFDVESGQVNASVRGTLFYVDAGSGESTSIALVDGQLAAGSGNSRLPDKADEAGTDTAWLNPFEQLDAAGGSANIGKLKSELKVEELLEGADRPLLQQMLLDVRERTGEDASANQRLSELAEQLEKELDAQAREARNLLDYVLTDTDFYAAPLKGGYLDEKTGILYRSIQSEFPAEINFYTNAGQVKWAPDAAQSKPVIFRIHDPKLVDTSEMGVLDHVWNLGASTYPKVAGWEPLDSGGELYKKYTRYIQINGAGRLPIEELMRRSGQEPADYVFIDIQDQ